MIGKIALQFAMATALPCAAAFAAEELWSVREGANGEIDGVWIVKIDNDEISGFARMFDPNGEPLTYVISGKRAEGEFNLDRKSPSNGIVCTYSFKNMPQEQKDTEDPVPGASSCDGKSQLWMATKMPDPEQSGN